MSKQVRVALYLEVDAETLNMGAIKRALKPFGTVTIKTVRSVAQIRGERKRDAR